MMAAIAKLALPMALAFVALALGGIPVAHAGDEGPVRIATDEPRESHIRLPSEEDVKRGYFSDRTLITQDGDKVRFYSDVLKDRVVLINFIFTHCPGVCPVQCTKLTEVQKLLHDRGGERLRIVSISVDPKRDTPDVLKRFAKRFDAKDGWMFLTGKQEDIDWITSKLGAYNLAVEAHSPIMLLGNVKTGDWVKMRPDASAKTLVAELRELLAVGTAGS